MTDCPFTMLYIAVWGQEGIHSIRQRESSLVQMSGCGMIILCRVTCAGKRACNFSCRFLQKAAQPFAETFPIQSKVLF